MPRAKRVEAASTEQDAPPRLTRASAARVKGVSVSTIRNWERSGRLRAEVGPDGVHYFDPAAVQSLAPMRPEQQAAPPLRAEPVGVSVVRQLTKHVEFFAEENRRMLGVALGAMNDALEKLQVQNEAQGKTIEKLVSEKMETLGVVEDLYSKKAERELDTKRAEAKLKIISDGAERFMPLLSLLARHVSGRIFGGAEGAAIGAAIGPRPGEPRTTSEAVIESLLETIQPSQLEALQRIFGPDQMILLVQLFEDYGERKRAAGKPASKEEAAERDAREKAEKEKTNGGAET